MVFGVDENERVCQVVEEVVCVEGGELYNVVVLMGGMVVQEMIKIIIKQYIFIDNICLFDGISSWCQIFCLQGIGEGGWDVLWGVGYQ